jgi:hypothetical protein
VKRLAASLVFSAALLAVMLGGSRPAVAQLGTAGTTGTTNTTFAQADFFVGIQAVQGTNLSLYDQARFLNKARCDCTTPAWLFVTLTNSGFAKRRLSTSQTGTIRVRVGGTQCADPVYGGTCAELYSDSLATFLAQGKTTIPTNVRVLSTQTVASTSADGGVTVGGGSFKPTTDCAGTTPTGFQQIVWVLIDSTGDGAADGNSPQFPFKVDLVPPPAPAAVAIRPGNEAIVMDWTAVDFATNQDLQGYQIFCRRGANLQVFADGTFTPYAQTCPGTRTAMGAEGLDPLFACSPLLARSTTEHRVKILQNDIVYGATVVAIDNSGNASTPDMFEAEPTKTLSFYDYYRSGGIDGDAAGGFCAVAPDSGEGRGPLVGGGIAGAAAVAALVLRARRRRSRS